jgi:peptidoglycan/LPS O-acetylase OafA/YrhL
MDKRTALAHRLLARYPRLNLPIAVALALALIVYHAGLYFNHEVAALSGSGWFAGIIPTMEPHFSDMLSMLLWGGVATGDARLLPPLWTLKVELIGSLFLLIFLLLLPRIHGLWLVVLLIPVGFFLHAVFGAEMPYYLALFFGAILAGMPRLPNWLRTISILLAIFFGSFTYQEYALHGWLPATGIFDPRTVWCGLGAIFLIMGVANPQPARWWSSPPLLWLGRLSYSLYLTHFIVLVSLASIIWLVLPKTVMVTVLVLICYLMLCLLLAYLFWRYVDTFAIRSGERLARFLLDLRRHKPTINSSIHPQ